ncbi:MAG: phosphatidylglycerophosphatase A [Chlorobiaceae bacterium]
MKYFLAKIISTCFGIGYFPIAPGTVTSIVAILVYVFCPVIREISVLLVLTFFCAIAGVWAGTVMEEHYGSDPSIVTIDELVGQWLALVALPTGVLPILLAFAFFRFFDIVKPGPVDTLQRLSKGWGIMADDILAGFIANLSVRGVLLLLYLL